MFVIAIIVTVFGVVGTILSLYLRFTVKSPILSTRGGDEVVIGALTFQKILNLVFTYFIVLHLIFILIGVKFLLAVI
ncbi:MAG: hypothetical protein ACE5HO_02485 [bacterium]